MTRLPGNFCRLYAKPTLLLNVMMLRCNDATAMMPALSSCVTPGRKNTYLRGEAFVLLYNLTIDYVFSQEALVHPAFDQDTAVDYHTPQGSVF